MSANVAMSALVAVSLIQAPLVRASGLPDEAAGIDGIASALMSVYDQFDVVALGEMHARKTDSDLRIALVRHPDFAKKVRTIVVEFATTAEQTTLDRYIRGENASRAQLERVRPRQPGSLTSEDPIYSDFLAAVRDVNSRLPASSGWPTRRGKPQQLSQVRPLSEDTGASGTGISPAIAISGISRPRSPLTEP